MMQMMPYDGRIILTLPCQRLRRALIFDPGGERPAHLRIRFRQNPFAFDCVMMGFWCTENDQIPLCSKKISTDSRFHFFQKNSFKLHTFSQTLPVYVIVDW
eukprot:350453_1